MSFFLGAFVIVIGYYFFEVPFFKGSGLYFFYQTGAVFKISGSRLFKVFAEQVVGTQMGGFFLAFFTDVKIIDVVAVPKCKTNKRPTATKAACAAKTASKIVVGSAQFIET